MVFGILVGVGCVAYGLYLPFNARRIAERKECEGGVFASLNTSGNIAGTGSGFIIIGLIALATTIF